MNPLMAYAWPVFAAGLIIGAIVGTIVLRRRLGGARRIFWVAGAAASAIAATAIWSGPLGAADRFAAEVEDYGRRVLIAYEMEPVRARLGRGPLSRKFYLSGPADAFQRGELEQIMANVPGAGTATWSSGERALPLLFEGALAALAGVALGWLLAGLVEWHRRYNAQWSW